MGVRDEVVHTQKTFSIEKTLFLDAEISLSSYLKGTLRKPVIVLIFYFVSLVSADGVLFNVVPFSKPSKGAFYG